MQSIVMRNITLATPTLKYITPWPRRQKRSANYK